MQDILTALGLSEINDGCSAGPASGELIESRSPTTGEVIAKVRLATREDYERTVVAAQDAFTRFRTLPAPKRGEIVRQLGEAMRELKDPLGKLISLEMGKIYQEGLGEVQEAIDMAEFCVGLSRQLYGLTMHSERPGHRMYEQWHPLGVIGIITAFNFPCAVWAWNALVAAVCGDTMIWKPSLETPLIAVACQKICDRVLAEHGLEGAMGLCVCDHETSVAMTEDRRLPLISATGSCRMGREVGKVVAGRLARCLLELGGNNAIIVMNDADLDLAVRGVLFGAVGTAGQRCTSTRRVLLHKDIAETFTERLLKAYTQVRIGDPLAEGTLMGPLINERSVDAMENALVTIKDQGGEIILEGGRATQGDLAKGHFVTPAIVKAPKGLPMMQEEVFAPILYLVEIDSLEEGIALQNDVPQGLSSAVFTASMRSAERFLSPAGSDCGIANVNIGTSGAEIGGAFGGEKDTGGGREAGSDAWKAYMRRQTCTINYSEELPLAQGITFG
ncbi:MAG: L-piperidine-6-carboxylate dehydrogenase [Planctomycetota bacterium]|jgi:aldehyde dehydrogenase (NAD+)